MKYFHLLSELYLYNKSDFHMEKLLILSHVYVDCPPYDGVVEPRHTELYFALVVDNATVSCKLLLQ